MSLYPGTSVNPGTSQYPGVASSGGGVPVNIPQFRLKWGVLEERAFEYGLDRAVIYPHGGTPTPWNGLVSVDAGSPAVITPYYVDGMLAFLDAEPGDHVEKISALYFPHTLWDLLGFHEDRQGFLVDNQRPAAFDFTYRTLVGNGSSADPFGFQIHLVYQCLMSVAPRARKTVGQTTEISDFSFDIVCQPIHLPPHRPSAHYIIDSRRTPPDLYSYLENILYGNPEWIPRIPRPLEISQIMAGS